MIILAPGWEKLELTGAELWFCREWFQREEADAMQAVLRLAIPWETHRIRLFGREIDTPRRSCWIGDPRAVYTYSRMRFEPHPWPVALRDIRERLREGIGLDFNSVLANLYRNGRDKMGWHSDDEPELGPCPTIASLSLGATRRFIFKPRCEGGRGRLAVDLPHGSLLLMAGETQARYRHALPGTRAAVGERINLTFRQILHERKTCGFIDSNYLN
ncbi:MAG: alpha-ketoglutarate-dependent dioxygenase AlkB [Lysobacteraceae bacterium]|nr:MAG: alpha-ketoglutarate-dependent dioxygenase AlkB [Xanthomonadaceae bacterium]